MAMDIELQGVYDDTKRITVLIPHWETVLKPQGQWEPVEQFKEQPLLLPQEEEKVPEKASEELTDVVVEAEGLIGSVAPKKSRKKNGTSKKKAAK